METQNKQWVCHPILDTSGQLGPEDLSATNKILHNRSCISDKLPEITNNTEQQVIVDIQNKNGLDQFFVQQIEDAICENSRQTILHILDEVSRLTSTEKLLLYLKLPTDYNNVSDPLRQPLNPLGSRTEISQTIMWIRTHLEEDPELSLPKQEVYNEYTVHCANNKMKPLSTADFGKVMKQVYPSVRPRRLGTRGNSRYCYAGLRKRFKLEVPQLPELGDRPQSTEAVCTQSELTTAACTIICEWAEGMLGKPFQSVYILASYLIRNTPQTINSNSGAVALFVSYTDGMHGKDALSQELLPYSNHVNLKHREAQLQLQRKLQQRETKRKLQLQSPKSDSKGKCKKSKLQNTGSTPTRTVSIDSAESASPKPQGYQMNIVCDKSTNECTNVPTLPDFNSFHNIKKPLSDSSETSTIVANENKPVTTITAPTDKDNGDGVNTASSKDGPPVGEISNTQKRSRSISLDTELYESQPAQDPDTSVDLKPNFAGKLPIPRLPGHKMKQPCLTPKSVILQAPKKCSPRNLKYKSIQPKPVNKCDTPGDLTQGNSDGAVNINTMQIGSDDLKSTDYLTRERLISVSNVDKDALDDYLHGGNNSQEQEEELMQYFKNNNNNNNNSNNDTEAGFEAPRNQLEPEELSNGSKSDKLSQLRLLLEQNLNSNIGAMSAPRMHESIKTNTNAFIKARDKHNFAASAGLTMLSQNVALQSQLNSVKRRVSFETSVIDNDTVPPSPNTRRKNFSFTPISPGPHSPGGGRQSKCSSTNASPFVSPRNTPVPRAKATNHAQVPASFVAQQTVPTRKHTGIIKPTLKTKLEPELYAETEKMFGELIEEKHFVNPTDIIPKCNLPMSAPPSPMLPYKQKLTNSILLQKLLDSNSKVSYITDYEKSVQNTNQSDTLSQEVSQLLSENNPNYPVENSYRSQSVPLSQMTSFKSLMSPCMPNTQQTQFNFGYTSANNSVTPTPVPNEFSEFESFPELNTTGLNNENLNQILNILETNQTEPIDEDTTAPPISETSQSVENVFTFDTNATILNSEIMTQNEFRTGEMHKLIRSQSIDIDLEMRGMCGNNLKYNQPSRSVPSTPLPYTKTKNHLNLNLNNNQDDVQQQPLNIMFGCRQMSNQDFLLNGQPVKGGKFRFDQGNEATDLDLSVNEQSTYPQNLNFTMTETLNNDNKITSFTRNSAENYGARRNLNPILEQQYPNEADEFNTAVPRINRGTS